MNLRRKRADSFRLHGRLPPLRETACRALRPTDEADAHAEPDGGWLTRELDALGLDLGGDRVDVIHRQSEVVEALIGQLK